MNLSFLIQEEFVFHGYSGFMQFLGVKKAVSLFPIKEMKVYHDLLLLEDDSIIKPNFVVKGTQVRSSWSTPNYYLIEQQMISLQSFFDEMFIIYERQVGSQGRQVEKGILS